MNIKRRGDTKEERMELYRQKMAKKARKPSGEEKATPPKKLPPKRMSQAELRKLFILE